MLTDFELNAKNANTDQSSTLIVATIAKIDEREKYTTRAGLLTKPVDGDISCR